MRKGTGASTFEAELTDEKVRRGGDLSGGREVLINGEEGLNLLAAVV